MRQRQKAKGKTRAKQSLANRLRHRLALPFTPLPTLTLLSPFFFFFFFPVKLFSSSFPSAHCEARVAAASWTTFDPDPSPFDSRRLLLSFFFSSALLPPISRRPSSGLQSPSKERALATSNLLPRLFLSLFTLFLKGTLSCPHLHHLLLLLFLLLLLLLPLHKEPPPPTCPARWPVQVTQAIFRHHHEARLASSCISDTPPPFFDTASCPESVGKSQLLQRGRSHLSVLLYWRHWLHWPRCTFFLFPRNPFLQPYMRYRSHTSSKHARVQVLIHAFCQAGA
ncbi:hypothetical protein J3F83DRAFT_356554 [Trichoderma novae-zelandiae]